MLPPPFFLGGGGGIVLSSKIPEDKSWVGLGSEIGIQKITEKNNNHATMDNNNNKNNSNTNNNDNNDNKQNCSILHL